MGMVQTVQFTISIRTDIGRTLSNKAAYIKDFFPCFGHRENTVSRISMVEYGLKKQGNVPVDYKKGKYDHTLLFKLKLLKSRDNKPIPVPEDKLNL